MIGAGVVQPQMGRLKTHWGTSKARIREHWPAVTDEDLEPCRYEIERLIRTLQLLTGEAREQIESFLAEIAADLPPAAGDAVQAVREGWMETSANVQQAAHCMADTACAWCTRVETAIRAHPIEATVSAFATGVMAGIATALVRSRR